MNHVKYPAPTNRTIISQVLAQNPRLRYEGLPSIKDDERALKFGEAVLGSTQLQNAFVPALINTYVVEVIERKVVNRYQKFWKPDINGDLKRVSVDIVAPEPYKLDGDFENLVQLRYPKVHEELFRINFQAKYKITTSYVNLRSAFETDTGLWSFIEDIIKSLNDSLEYTAYNLFTYLLFQAATSGKIIGIGVDPNNKEEVTAKILEIMTDFTFNTRDYNIARAIRSTRPEDVSVFMTNAFNAKYQTQYLANLFNMGEADFRSNMELVRSFTDVDFENFEAMIEDGQIGKPTQEQIDLMESVVAIIADQDAIQIRNNLRQATQFDNPENLTTNHWLHDWKIGGISNMENIVLLYDNTKGIKEPDSFDVVVGNVDTSKGTTINFNPPKINYFGSPMFLPTKKSNEGNVYVNPYGSYQFSKDSPTTVDGYAEIGNVAYKATTISKNAKIGDVIKLTKVDATAGD